MVDADVFPEPTPDADAPFRFLAGWGLLITLACACWIGGLAVAATLTGQSVLLRLLTGFVVPFLSGMR